MPLHDLGYRAWQGEKSSALQRWQVIATTGIRLAFRSTWLSRTLVLSWVPAIIVGVWFFLYEQSIVNAQYRQIIRGIVIAAGTQADLARAVSVDPASVRHQVWASLLLVFFRYPQGVLMLIVVGIVAPRLISYDLRNRGYLLYFSRPIQPAGYIFGKSLIICSFLALITTLPALSLYVVGLSLSPDMNVFWETWDLPFRILLASLVLMIPVASAALACSAITVETRYAAFSWFALWVVGWVSYSVLRMGETVSRTNPARFRRRRDFEENVLAEVVQQSDWELLSPFHVLGRVQQFVFGLYPEEASILPYLAVLVGVTFLSIGFVWLRIVSRLKA